MILPLSSWVGTGSYTTSTTNMYHKDFKEPKPALDILVLEVSATSTTNMYPQKQTRTTSTTRHAPSKNSTYQDNVHVAVVTTVRQSGFLGRNHQLHHFVHQTTVAVRVHHHFHGLKIRVVFHPQFQRSQCSFAVQFIHVRHP